MKPSPRQRRRVAVILQLWQNFDRGIIRGISGYVRDNAQWSVYVEEVERQTIPDLDAWDVDGLIVNFDNRKVVEELRALDKPIIAVGGGSGWYDPASGVPYVDTDGEMIGRWAAEHFLDRGFRHFAYCGYPKSRTNDWMIKRRDGFCNRLAEAGFGCDVFSGSFLNMTQWENAQQELAEWLDGLPKPVAVMGCYDYRARHVLEAARALNLRVPDDVAVIGVDNDVVCELADPPLSSIEQGTYQIGHTAASLLDQLMAGDASVPLRQAVPPVDLVSRKSSDLICVDDEAVAQALLLVRDQACSGLQTTAVAAQVGLSRGTLDKRMKAVIGRTVDQEIRYVRISRAKEMLARTGVPLREVASQLGFGTEQYFSTVFSKTLGMTPSDYRRTHRRSVAGD